MQLPQELLEAIVQTILDCPTLKSCSLAGSQLREPSQRILLHSMTLEGWDSQATREFLEDSPHIATYITVLTVYIPGRKDVADDDALEVTDFQWIFDRLDNVRHCALGGRDKENPILWPSLPPALSSTYLGFISRQRSLRELTTENIRGLPLDALLALFRVTPSLIASRVSILAASDDSTLSLRAMPGLLRLRLGPHCPSLCKLLVQPQHLAWTSRLTHLGIQAENLIEQESKALVQNTARTLRSLRVSVNHSSQRITSPPSPLPVLRFLEYDLPLTILVEPHFVAPIIDALGPAASPHLAKITLKLHYANPSLQGFPPSIQEGAMAALDAALAAHPARPALNLVWHVIPSVRAFTITQEWINRYFDAFVETAQRAMPSASAQGRLIFDRGPPAPIIWGPQVPRTRVDGSLDYSTTGWVP